MIKDIQLKSQKIATLITLYLKNKISKEQYSVLKNWIEESETNRKVFEECTDPDFFDKSMKEVYADTQTVELIWKHIRSKTISKTKRRKLYPRISVAASILLLLGISIAFYFYNFLPKDRIIADLPPGESMATLKMANGELIKLEKDSVFIIKNQLGTEIRNTGASLRYSSEGINEESHEVAYDQLTTGRGGEYRIVLSDGTKVHLNAETELKFPLHFTAEKRKVFLQGEAIFEVSPDAAKPFEVEVNGTIITVLGTTFNIRAYPENKNVITTLVEGSVYIQHQQQSQILRPNQQAIVTGSTNEITINEVDPMNYIGWHYGRFIYDNQSLEEIMTDLSRWYNFEVSYKDPEAKNVYFSCDLKRLDNLNTLLLTLEKTHKVRFKAKENKIKVEMI